jgi:AAA+ superfamily predicted ATPase
MKRIREISLGKDESCLKTHDNSSVTVKRKGYSYTRNARIIQTQHRILVEVKSTLGGTKEIIEISYLDVQAIRTKSEISSTGLTLTLNNDEGLHLDFFRNHLRACQIFIQCCLVAMTSSTLRDSPISLIENLLVDAIVPDDLFSSDIRWGEGLPGVLAEFGIILCPGKRPTIDIAKLSSAFATYPTDRYSASTKLKDESKNPQRGAQEVVLNRYIESNDKTLSGKPYIVLQVLREHGEYVTQGQAVLWVEVEGKETMIAATTTGYISYKQKLFTGGTYFFGSEVFSVESREKDRTSSASTPKSSPVTVQQGGTSRESVRQLLDELDSLVGLDDVKREIRGLINYAEIQMERTKRFGLSEAKINRHLVLTGSPGTGKTTIARLIGRVYAAMGLLSKGHFVETDRSGLVAGYLGQTAIKTKEVLDNSKGGVLFIDEAYALAPYKQDDQYGKESVDTILKYMEDYRDDIVIAVAGYSEPMKTFLHSNTGLKSRFNTFIHFSDYSQGELLQVYKGLVEKSQMAISPGALLRLKDILSRISELRSENFANARAMRNLFELSLRRQANRLALKANRTDEDLTTIDEEDLEYEDAVLVAN